MKKILSLLSVAAAIVFAGCQKSEELKVNVGERRLSLETSAEIFDTETSRTVYTDGAGLAWTQDDLGRLGVTSNVQDAGASNSIVIDETTGKAVFGAVLAPPATDVMTYYPWNTDRHAISVDNGSKLYRISEKILAEQSQPEAGRMDASNAPMIGAKPIHIGDGADGVQTVKVDNPMILTAAILRFRVYDASGNYASEAVRSVSLTANGDAKVNATAVSTGSITEAVAPEIAFEGGSASSKVSLETVMPLGSAASAEAAKGIYLAVSPFATAGVTYTVATNAANYTFVSSAAKTFETGNIYDIALNLANPNAVREDLGGEIVKELKFVYGNPTATHTFNATGGDFLNGAIATLTLDGVDVKSQMTADNVRLEAEYEEGASAWLKEVRFENTGNFQWFVSAGVNPTTAERHAKVYMYFNDVKSTNFIEFHQQAGTGDPYVKPVLTKTYETEIATAGETVAAAASLSLADDAGKTLDFATYKDKVSLACTNDAVATLNDDGTISIVFPANEEGANRIYALTVSGTYNTSARVTFTQTKKEGGEVAEHTFEYTIFNNAQDGSKGTGFGPGAGTVGDWYRFENITIDGKKYMPGDDMRALVENAELLDALMKQCFSFGEITNDDVQVPNGDPLTTNPESFVTLEPWTDGGAAIYVRIVLGQNTDGVRRTFKIITKDGSGVQMSSIVYFQNA